jgi:acetyl esterase/lipase
MSRAVVVALAVLALLPAVAHAGVTVRRGLLYGHGQSATGPVALRLDLYEPSGAARRPRPVVVIVHGGGFRMGSRAEGGVVPVARGLAAQGTVAVNIDYRLKGQAPVPSARVQPLVDALPDVPLRAAPPSPPPQTAR